LAISYEILKVYTSMFSKRFSMYPGRRRVNIFIRQQSYSGKTSYLMKHEMLLILVTLMPENPFLVVDRDDFDSKFLELTDLCWY